MEHPINTTMIKNNKKKRISFKYKVAILSMLCLFSALFFFSLTLYKQQKSFTEKYAISKASILTKSFSNSVQRDLLLENYDEIIEQQLLSAEFPGIRKIIVTDQSGDVISYVTHENDSAPEEVLTIAAISPPINDALQVSISNTIVHVWSPIFEKGWVKLEYDYSIRDDALSSIMRSAIFTAAGLAILTALYFLMLFQRPIEQLRKLINFAKGLDFYREKQSIDVKSSVKEISELNDALNHSAERIYTQSQKIIHSEDQYRRIVNNIQEGIFETDNEGRITFVNDAWEKITGYKKTDLIGTHISKAIDAVNKVKIFDFLTDAIQKNTDGFHFDLSFTDGKGSCRWAEAWISIIKDASGCITGYTGTLADITERKLTEKILIDARDSAENANRMKGQFVASVSHEIRTPLNGVLGMAQLLLDTKLDSEQRDYVKTLYQSGLGLLAIINDILDFSKIESGKLTLENTPFDLQQSLDDVCDLFLPKIQDKQLELIKRFDPQCPRLFIGDVGKIRQIILNFLSNAIKFTDKGQIIIDVQGLETTSDFVKLRISITDTGIGISPENQKLLFHEFSQVDSGSTRRFDGTGLGLAISRSLATLMGGSVNLKSEENNGSTFYIELTLARQTCTSLPEYTCLDNVRLLIVDDLEVNRRILREALGAQGAIILEAANAQDALNIMSHGIQHSKAIDIAILDLNMPDMKGDDLGIEIRSNPLFSHTKLVLLSSSPLRGEGDRIKEIGFSKVMYKPAKLESLVKALQEINRNAQSVISETSKVPTAQQALEIPARVLLAEDNMVNQRVAMHMLEKMGATVDVAANGLEAVRMSAQFHYDLILMDCHMPELDGFAATQLIRQRQAQSLTEGYTPIIAITANTMDGDRERCLAAGMNDFLGKPIRQQDLFAALQKYASTTATELSSTVT